jgi:hypothetical protein
MSEEGEIGGALNPADRRDVFPLKILVKAD